MINTIIIVLVVVFAVSLFLLYLPKLIKFIKNSKAKSKNAKKKKAKGKKKGDDKLKASKAVQEIRPIVKPANKEKAEKESKDIEAKRQGKALPNAEKPQQLDFKYSATKKSSIEDEEEFNPRNFAPRQNVETNQAPNSTYSIQTGKGNPLNRDIKKEFEDIRAFLDLPENKGQQNLNDKYEAAKKSISRQAQNIQPKRIDASAFNNKPTYFSNAKEEDDDFVVPNSYRANTKYAKPTPYAPAGTKPVEQKPLNYKIDKTPININELKKGESKQTKKEEEYLKFDDENIDLNTLSPKLKRFIIENILNRRNFD